MDDERTMYERAGRLRLPLGETDRAKQYTMPDPRRVSELLDRTSVGLRGDSPVMLSRGALLELHAVARAYLHLTTHPTGQERCVAKLREVWRYLRARAQREEAESMLARAIGLGE